MIVGTAGHIDHGKTTLVRAMTGIDTDRLPEEKARGISIELGYAFLDVPGSTERIGFIDVPGHERLVHTMLAGATGIDFGLLLVAADDGVMPQTREHLAVLALLGLANGAVAITKADRVDGARITEVRDAVTALLADTPLANAPILPISARSGDGVMALRERLFDAARAMPPRSDDGRAFRLAIDRAFTLDGVGTVVTGTVHAGTVRIGDELALTPSHSHSPGSQRARVRSLHAQSQSVSVAHAGQRCAIGLAGTPKTEVSRGQWLVTPDIALSTERIDTLLTLWHGEAGPLRSGTPVHVHIGASSVLGSVAVLQLTNSTTADALPPGGQALVQLVLRAPIATWRGDRVVLRDASASRTLAGGIVLDPFAPARYRRTPQRLAELAAAQASTPAERLQARVAVAPNGVSTTRWRQSEGLVDDVNRPWAADDWQLGTAQRDAVIDATLGALAACHAREPEMPGPDAARLRRLAAPRLPEALWAAVLDALKQSGRVRVHGAFVHLPEHALRLSAADETIAQKIAPLLATAGFEGRWARDLARDTSTSEPLMRTALARLAQRGELHQAVRDLYYTPAAMAQLAAHARAAAIDGAVTAAAFRDATGLGRKRAIQLLEYFDRIGLLRRVGDEHRLRRDSTLFLPAADAR